MFDTILNLLISLTQYICVLMVITFIVINGRLYSTMGRQKMNFRNGALLSLIFGFFSIYGTLAGSHIFGAIANTRDLGPTLAGLVGGPLVGLGAGLIGATHRYFMGGFTVIPCTIATILAGLIGGIVYLIKKRTIVTPFQGMLVIIFVEVIHMGLVLLLARPFNEAMLLVENISLPMIFANALGLYVYAFMIGNYRKQQETAAAKEQIEGELKAARQIQSSFLPRTFPPFPDRKEFDLFAVMNPAKEVGGDFYDFALIDDQRLYLIIGDVSGKGVPAALFMVIAKTLLRNEALKGSSPAEILSSVNKILCFDNDACMFATIFCAMLDTRTGELTFANAGHNPPLLSSSRYKYEFVDVNKVTVLGLLSGTEFVDQKLWLKAGDILFLYTDGVTEAADADNRQYTATRLNEMISAIDTTDVTEIVQCVLKDIHAFVKEAPQSDDITILAMKYNG